MLLTILQSTSLLVPPPNAKKVSGILIPLIFFKLTSASLRSKEIPSNKALAKSPLLWLLSIPIN